MDAQLNKKTAYITGTSRGIGKALAETLLQEGYTVIGLSRSNAIEHPNFEHISLDLSDISAVKSFQFREHNRPVLLVNNAGMIGTIQPVGSLGDADIEAVMNVNTIAPQLLMNRFYATYHHLKNGHILNISSGAGKRPIDAWATYCASKAALDLFSNTIRAEWEARSVKGWHIHSIAPGVVDTKMQDEIRQADPQAFKMIEKFVNLKENQELSSPQIVANQLLRVVKNPDKFENTVISVRDFN